ncbi:MAG TPA: hypothetical protein VF928_04385 [Usitatibacteraceae bacterium]
MKNTILLTLSLTLTACASHAPSTQPESTVIGPAAKPGLQTQVADAATSPLTDLNLVRADIPPVLAAAQKAPYQVPADQSCASLTVQVEAIDAALGADLDVASTDSNPGLIPRGQEAATKSAVGALRGAAEGLIPYRSWVRKLSGAERYSREVSAAIAAGIVRRSFLKGLGQAAGCQAPAAPRH